MSTLAQLITSALASVVLASGAAYAQTGAKPDTRAASGNSSSTLLVPASQPDPMLNGGCWVQLMDNIETPRSKEYLTILGAKYMPELETASGKEWSGRADGISIGPNAQVTAYDQKDYRGHAVTIRPNSIVQDLRASLGFVNSIESMKIDCRNS